MPPIDFPSVPYNKSFEVESNPYRVPRDVHYTMGYKANSLEEIAICKFSLRKQTIENGPDGVYKLNPTPPRIIQGLL